MGRLESRGCKAAAVYLFPRFVNYIITLNGNRVGIFRDWLGGDLEFYAVCPRWHQKQYIPDFAMTYPTQKKPKLIASA
jgi:hypothetical protein